MIYLVFMNYSMLVAICGHIGIITSDSAWLALDVVGVVAMLVHIALKYWNKKKE